MPEIIQGLAASPHEFEEEYGMSLETLSKRIEERRSEKEFGLKSLLGEEYVRKQELAFIESKS